MLWFFDRDDQQVEVETRFDNATREYMLIVRWPDGRSETERCPDVVKFRGRILALSEQLKAMNWRTTGSPIILPDGWSDDRRPN